MRNEFLLQVKEKRTEAEDAVSLRFEIPATFKEQFKFKAGQFVGVTAEINGESVHRSYSISSSPFEEEFLEISIKKVEGGKMSTYLVEQVKEGDALELTPPAGQFYKNFENKRHHIMFAAGSGVTPMMSIMRFLEKAKPDERITLFYWNRRRATTMFAKELEELSKRSGVNVFYALTQESVEDESVVFNERLNADIMKQCFYKWSTTLDMPIFYLCGPNEFMDKVEVFLGQKGFDSSQVRKESFNISPSDMRGAGSEIDTGGGPHLVGDLSKKSDELGTCVGVIDGETVEVEPEEGETILESFLRSGESPPYSCMEGTCIACQCKVVEGLVEMPKETFLSEEELKDGLVLSCQAKVRSKKVKVDFDDF